MSKPVNDPLGYYEILQVSYKADEAEIKQNYRELAKKWHPDHNSDASALDVFQKISVAYDILSDEEKRLVYDLLAQAYGQEKFPDMFSLKIYKNRAEQEDLTLQAVKLWKVRGKITATQSTKTDEVCNYKEARKLLLQASLANWALGWWSLGGIKDTIQALIYNIKKVGHNNQPNLRLLLHNAEAYRQENQKEKAFIMAKRALAYANPEAQELINRYLKSLGVAPQFRLPRWNYAVLKAVQLIVPTILLLLAAFSFSTKVMTEAELKDYFAKVKEIVYYQEVRFNSGGETVDDMVVGKILNIPVDVNDPSKLYHLTSGQKVMFGPGDDFDMITELAKNKTVRITGITPDEVWYRVMLDNGDMGFIRREFLKKGIGTEIPFGSKIYKAPSL